MFRIVFFDIDNTLMSHTDYQISDKTIESLNKLKEKDIKIVACTGRNEHELKGLGIIGKIDFDAYIFMAGQLISVDNNIIFKNPFVKKLIEEILTLDNQYKLECLFYSENELYSNSEIAMEKYYEDNGHFIEFNRNVEEIKNKDCYEMSVFCGKTKAKRINKRHFKMIDYLGNCYDMFPVNGGKGKGVQLVLEYFGIDKTDALCFGDSMNDFDMFEEVGFSVAMGNAGNELKNVADYVTTHVDDNGVCNALIDLGIIKRS